MRIRIPKLRWLFLAFVMGLFGWYFSRPVVAIYYSTDAQESIGYIYNENNYIHRGVLNPGDVVSAFTPMFPDLDSWIIVDLPMSYNGVEIRKAFSRVDVYIDAESNICAENRYGFFERFKRSNPMGTGGSCKTKNARKPHECSCTPDHASDADARASAVLMPPSPTNTPH